MAFPQTLPGNEDHCCPGDHALSGEGQRASEVTIKILPGINGQRNRQLGCVGRTNCPLPFVGLFSPPERYCR